MNTTADLVPRRRQALRLLVYGVRWPPETFIQRKLERLARRGARVTVAVPVGDGGAGIPGVAVEAVVPRGRPWAGTAVSAAASLLRLFLVSPRRAAAVARAAGRPTASGRVLERREALARLRAYARLAALRPDVVHFEWNTAAVHFLSLVDALGCPMVLSRRGSENVYPHAPTMQQLAAGFPLTFGRATAVHCVSEAVRQEAERHGLDPAKSWVIRPGVDEVYFRPPPSPRQPDGSLRLAAVGCLRWCKGYEYALLALAALGREGVPVSLEILGGDPTPEVGEPSERERLRRTIAELGLERRVQLRGHVEPAEVRAVLQRSDALLHLSLVEGLPNAVLEAMACGLPVVVTDVGGTTEAVRDGVEGVVVEPRDARAAASALRELWRDPALRSRLGAAGRARVEAEFTLERQTDAWLELYEHVARNGYRSPRRLRLAEVGLRWRPETFIRRKLQNLAAMGLEPRVASWDSSPGDEATRLPGVGHDRLPQPGESRRRRLLGLAADGILLLLTHPRRAHALVAARRQGCTTLGWRSLLRLARLRADVVHLEWLTTAVACSPLLDAWRVPVAVSCHGAQLQVRPYTAQGAREGLREELPRLFGRVAAVHCVSEAVRQEAERYGLEPTKAWLIRQAVDTEFFRPPASPRLLGNDFHLVSVGWLRWIKGYEYALLAVAELAREGIPVSLEIVGGDPPAEIGEQSERERIRYAIADLGLEGRVRLRGLLGPAEVRAVLQRSDAFLHVSLSEGLPNAILEAMACELPVVATDVGGTGEGLRDGVEGFLVPPRDAPAAASALRALWLDPELRSRMGAAGRARVKAEFRPEQETSGFLQLYETLARNGRES